MANLSMNPFTMPASMQPFQNLPPSSFFSSPGAYTNYMQQLGGYWSNLARERPPILPDRYGAPQSTPNLTPTNMPGWIPTNLNYGINPYASSSPIAPQQGAGGPQMPTRAIPGPAQQSSIATATPGRNAAAGLPAYSPWNNAFGPMSSFNLGIGNNPFNSTMANPWALFGQGMGMGAMPQGGGMSGGFAGFGGRPPWVPPLQYGGMGR